MHSALIKAGLGLLACLVAPFSFSNNLPDANTPILKALVEQAQKEAQSAYTAPALIENDYLLNMSYSEYKAIRFKPDKSIWHKRNPYEVQLFHSGFLYKQAVKINVIDYANVNAELAFDSSFFSYDPPAMEISNIASENIAYAGFRVHYPINSQSYKDEFAVFLGATYFRLVGQHQHYGISSRAIAIDTGLAEGEEFPTFTEFWLIEPTVSKKLTVYAKLDSPSITGVFRFEIQPGKSTTADVSAWMFARQDIEKFGLAPFTSMFLYGENTKDKPDDFRPEIHDSDGVLLITDKDEQIWRPLTNPQRLRITSLSTKQPKAFGMLQRDIQYGHYLDSEAHYHQRPGLLVTPNAGFENGRLEIVEIPTQSETHDNIVAYWINNKPVKKGDALFVDYKVQTTNAKATDNAKAKVIRTLQGDTILPGEAQDEDNLTRRFVVDFDNIEQIDAKDLTADLTANNGRVEHITVLSTNFNRELRASFLVTPIDTDLATDIRLTLTENGKAISETWSYVYE
ncbi:glucan biosynthesis protein [Agaribacter marinus]|uniref:Glucans biosynthesis protein G n=1 Tax=Agaribacter marinus TaxID=1431249 RepID=A0AA37T0P9_9ALTE|nr:glucan biosynthesis protein G [Agaribacter marinus]GLR71625.1 glucans biosynthesis protein G [Agaribacter marinus]